MKSIFFLLVLLLVCLSCSSPSRWITRAELETSSDPNILSVGLTDSTTLEFDRHLGWYNGKEGVIEGVTPSGYHDTIPLSRVQRVELAGTRNSGGELALSLLVLGIVALIGGLLAIGRNGGL
jgi:hypothetical protein